MYREVSIVSEKSNDVQMLFHFALEDKSTFIHAIDRVIYNLILLSTEKTLQQIAKAS
jgi:hypothetical protein